MVTVFTPTYNRGQRLATLYQSLQSQSCKNFEWLIVDDGSTDETEYIVGEWIRTEYTFPIRYYKTPNGGKMRAINLGASLAQGDIFCGIDSDDWFFEDAIFSIIEAFKSISSSNSIAGVSFAKNKEVSIRNRPKADFIDCKNFERPLYGLSSDMILAFYTDIMCQYKIPVWEDEKFTPESVFIDQMALDGYQIRYFKKPVYGVEYLEDGLTAASWRLLRDNPMGYAMMYNVQLQYHKGLKQKIKDVIQFVSFCCLKGEYSFLLKCHNPTLAILLFIPGFLLSKRRQRQFQLYCIK